MYNSAVPFLASEWRKCILFYPKELRLVVRDLAFAHAEALAAYFYEHMLIDPAAKLFLSNERVQASLMGSMQQWIQQVFSVDEDADFKAVVELQHKVGEVHARIDLPIHLVLLGARTLKRKFALLLQSELELSTEAHRFAFEYVSDSVDIAMEVMSRAYGKSHDRKSRAEESYRLFSAVHNAAAEKSRQKTALLDWENQLMFDLTIGTPIDNLKKIQQSDFGLWFIHKGSHAFEGLPDVEVIYDSMNRITNFLPDIYEKNRKIDVLKDIRSEVRNIKLNINNLFDKYNEVEAGRDELTRLLSRKYLSVVLSKEVSYSRKRNNPFALIAIDLDYFKNVNDNYGHEAGDMVLQQLSELLINRSRAGDYVFRLGGEEFLILSVDTNEEGALRAANNIVQAIRAERFVIPNKNHLHLTASIGVTLFDGHPDYSLSLSRADKALYQAKNNGRDQVVYLEPSYVR